jgi:hypothetical protein
MYYLQLFHGNSASVDASQYYYVIRTFPVLLHHVNRKRTKYDCYWLKIKGTGCVVVFYRLCTGRGDTLGSWGIVPFLLNLDIKWRVIIFTLGILRAWKGPYPVWTQENSNQDSWELVYVYIFRCISMICCINSFPIFGLMALCHVSSLSHARCYRVLRHTSSWSVQFLVLLLQRNVYFVVLEMLPFNLKNCLRMVEHWFQYQVTVS